MSKRTYQQFCPLAYGLDIIGERWTLLIVRELGLGPRRFGDIQRGLGGISPNLLSTRLHSLQQAGVIERITLPPPAGVEAYTLTASGRELSAAMIPLAMWGMNLLPPLVPAEQVLSPIAGMQALHFLYRPTAGDTYPPAAEIDLRPDRFHVTFGADGLQITQGIAPETPLAFAADVKTVLALASLPVTAPTAPLYARVTIQRGNKVLLKRFFAAFAREVTEVPAESDKMVAT